MTQAPSTPEGEPLRQKERIMLYAIESKAIDMFGSIHLEMLFRTFRAAKELGYLDMDKIK